MRRRQADDSGGSLELLLDTICNTFGAIIFLALLMTVLLSSTTRTASRDTAGTRPAVSAADLTRLRAKVSSLEGEVGEVRQMLEDYRSSVARGTAPESVALVDELNRLRTEANASEVSQARLLMEAAEAQAAAARANAAQQAARAGRDRAAAAADQAAARLDAVRQLQSRLQTTQLHVKAKSSGQTVQATGVAPQERVTFKQEFGVLIRYGRMYLTHVHASGERQVNHEDFIVVPGLVEDHAHARPAGGVPLAAPEAAATLEVRLAGYPAAEWYPCIVVHPDSFEEFQVAKGWLVSKGYEYRLIPTSTGIQDSGATGSSRVQ
jgi:hypothetical protein